MNIKPVLIIYLIFASLNLWGQKINLEDYIQITKSVITQKDIKENLIKYSNFESHPVYDVDWVLILDTTFINDRVITNDLVINFIATNLNEMEISCINYWISPKRIYQNKNQLIYEFKTESLRLQDSTEYIEGSLTFKKVKNEWDLIKTEIRPYEFKEPFQIECFEKRIDCQTSFNRLNHSNFNNPFFGDWQTLIDSGYYEYFFTDDSLFIYTEFGHGLFNLRYEFTDNEYKLYNPDSGIIALNYKLIDKNKIKIFGSYKIIFPNDTINMNLDYTIEKIKSKEFKYSDVDCWGEKSNKYNCFIDSYDSEKYQNEFKYRMINYKHDKGLKN